MISSEFRAARITLGLTQEALAGELGLTSHAIAGMENGDKKVSKAVTREMEYRVAVAKTDAMLKASGLPECPVADGLLRPYTDDMSTEEMVKRSKAVIAHYENCPTCKARSDYASKHAPPIPEFPTPFWFRPFTFMEGLLERLPAPLRPPKDDRGEARRLGTWLATFFSILSIGFALILAIARLASGGQNSSWWRESVGMIVTFPVAYFVGFFVAATVYDLTRPIAGRFGAYVLRGGLIPPAIYGSLGIALTFITKAIDLSPWPIVVGLWVIGTLVGSVMWVVDRVRGNLPNGTDD
jgi:DNA-binding XRE family transcriptional regulator